MTTVAGIEYVRIRPVVVPIGLGYRLRMYRVTDLHDRKRIGPDHISRSNAARWVEAHGWRYVGPQEKRAAWGDR